MDLGELNLKIFDVSPEWSELTLEEFKNRDFTIPLVKGEPILDKGAKRSKAYYLNNDLKNKCVEKLFVDTFNNKKIFNGLIMTVNYYDKNNEIKLSFDKSIILGVKLGHEYLEKRRKRAFSDLKSRAIIYGFKEIIEVLYSFFKIELEDYYETGSDLFKNKIIEVLSNQYNKETLEFKVQNILNNSLDGENKVSDTMIYQMS